MTEEYTEDTDLSTVEGETLDGEHAEAEGEIAPVEPVRPPNPNLRWYVVNTFSSYENRAKASLEERIRQENLEEFFGEILIPTETVQEMKSGNKRNITRKFFPGYILVHMELTNATWLCVQDTPKVTGFVGGNKQKPRPIRDREVAAILGQMEEGATKPAPKQDFREGESVRVTDGPFMNFTGTIEEVRPDKQKLRVMVSIFGRATPVELDFVQVESV